jgi:hypothetical protein
MEIRKEESEEEKEEIDEEKEEESNEENEEESNNNKNNNEKNEDMQKNEIETNINTEKEIEQEQKNPDDLDLEATSTYILKYTRKGDELKEIAEETGLRKSENCLFMLNIKLIKSDSVLTENNIPFETSENFLVFCCHEIAAIYFDEIYERVYTLDDLAKENKYFKVFESTEEAKNVIDETIRKNEKNDKKIFLAFKDKELKLHMKLSFFDKEKEIVLNIPKKKLNDEDKINLLPEFLKEIQDKMNHLSEENKKMKIKKTKVYNNRIKEIKNNYRANNTFNFDISNNKNDIKDDAKEKKLDKTTINNSNILNEISKDNISDINASTNLNNTTKKIRKKVKVVKKKQTKLEENFF